VFASAIGWLSQHAAIVLLLNLSLGFFGVPALAETLLLTAGVMMARDGRLPWTMVLAAALGSAVGMTICFLAGRFGARLAPLPLRQRRQSRRLIRIQEWCGRVGPWSIVLTFFTPGLRHIAATAAGATRLELRRFIVFAVSGACMWAALLLTGGYLAGQQTGAGGAPAQARYLGTTVRARAIVERVHAVLVPHAIHEVRRLRGDPPPKEFVVAAIATPVRGARRRA
jgi:membrane protein DedA with SNARE-associated domain